MRFIGPARLALLLALCVASPANADIIIGPGDINATSHAGSGDSINTDLFVPITLDPGTYTVSLFNHRFLDGGGAFKVSGSITPLVMVVFKPDYSDIRPIAIGDPVTFTGTTPFVSTTFGGTNTFTLGTTTTVHAGFYWHTEPEPGQDIRDPLPYVHGPNINVVGYFSGALPPVIGVPIEAPARGLDHNLFAFSIEITPVPEPTTAMLAIMAAFALCLATGAKLFRRKLPA